MGAKKGWSQWNVALWIGSDEGLYRTAVYYKSRFGTKNGAARMVEMLKECGVTETPDGAKYTKTSLMHALAGI